MCPSPGTRRAGRRGAARYEREQSGSQSLPMVCRMARRLAPRPKAMPAVEALRGGSLNVAVGAGMTFIARVSGVAFGTRDCSEGGVRMSPWRAWFGWNLHADVAPLNVYIPLPPRARGDTLRRSLIASPQGVQIFDASTRDLGAARQAHRLLKSEGLHPRGPLHAASHRTLVYDAPPLGGPVRGASLFDGRVV